MKIPAASFRCVSYLCSVLLMLHLLVGVLNAKSNDSLEEGFDHPSESAKPWTWWHWVSGNVSKEGISADLEAMKQIGLGGAQIFTVDQSNVKGAVKFMSAEWRDLIHFTMQEGARLHLEISMEGCDGWCESGGPWVTPAQSMQKIVWSEREVVGGMKVALDMPQPETIRNYYQDIAYYAFPTPERTLMPSPLKITSSEPSFDGEKFLKESKSPVSITTGMQPHWIEFEYANAVSPQSVLMKTQLDSEEAKRLSTELQAADEHGNFRKVCSLTNGMSVNFPQVTSKRFRFWRGPLAENDLMDGKNQIPVLELSLAADCMRGYEAKVGIRAKDDAANFFEDLSLKPSQQIDPKSMIDLTGRKEWDAPAGNWTIVRIGHTSTGATTHPSTTPGLECNKLSSASVNEHIANMFNPVMADSPKAVGTTFKNILLDSWECGCENWTEDLSAEFKKRRGYDLTPWLPALTRRIVGSAEETQRFLWDYRRTLADLLAEKHYGGIQQFAHEHGMGLSSEAPGIDLPTIADNLLCKKYCDIPMGEFWVNKSREGNIDDPKEAASAAHIYGQKIAATESFTSTLNTAAWKNDPYSLKALGDEEFCLGVNKFIFHRYTHQPWLNRKPGMSMGPWGINFERTNTWWKPGSAWIAYLTRCQELLQRGHFTADLCYFYGEGVPVRVRYKALSPAVPQGYDYDVCNADVLLNLMQVKDGNIVTPSGMSYRLLLLPPMDRMTLPVLKKVMQLVEAGASVYGTKPLHSPSLSGYPSAEAELKELADKLWGDCDGKTVLSHSYGKGRILWGIPLEKALGIPPDFAAKTGDFLFIHRIAEDTDIYFVSHQGTNALTTDCSFRMTGKTPELWHPDTGKKEIPAIYSSTNGVTTIPIHFDPVGSVFLIFRPSTKTNTVASISLDGMKKFTGGEDSSIGLPIQGERGVALLAYQSGIYDCQFASGKNLKVEVSSLPQPLFLVGSWKLSFPPKSGAPDHVLFDHLLSWTESPNEGVKYFSGTATYSKKFDLPNEYLRKGMHLFLNLGSVKNLAEVTLNGKHLGILWKEPFRIEMTGAVQEGENHLEIKVTNLWPNRLIGDQKLPEKDRTTWTSVSLYKGNEPLLPSGLLGPVTIIPAQRITFQP